MEDNWPLLTVSKGFFEGIRAVRGGASKATGGALAMEDDGNAGGEGAAPGGAWGDDDDLGLDDEDRDEFRSVDGDGEEGEGGGGGERVFVVL